jgi:two-component system, OmpR family, alkaline phosphatase synthesis response regulator PhoP
MRALPHVVHIASDGETGLQIIERERPSIVFTDVSMPRLDGMQLLDIMKMRAELADIPVVLMTASVQRGEIEEGLRHGASDVLRKPFGPAELRSKVEEILARTDTTAA